MKLFLMLVFLTLVFGQQDMVITPNNPSLNQSTNQPISLTIYSSQPNITLRWTLSNPCQSTCTPATIFSIGLIDLIGQSVNQSINQSTSWLSLSISQSFPIPIQQLTVARLTGTVIPSLIRPGSINQSIIIMYSYGNQRMSQSINLTINCLQDLTLIRSINQSIIQPINQSLMIGVGESIVHTVRVKSLINQSINITIKVNQLYGDLINQSINPSINHPNRPLLTVFPSFISINQTNWNESQTFIVSSISTNQLYGNRWSLIDFTYQTDDMYLFSYTNLFQSINVSIIEFNQPGLSISPKSLTLVKNSINQSINFSLTCEPREIVQIRLIDNPVFWWQPSLLLWHPTQWNQSINVKIFLYEDFSLGNQSISLPMSSLESYDRDFDRVPTSNLTVRLIDFDSDYWLIEPMFGPPGTVITINWLKPRTFDRLIDSQSNSTVNCIFGANQYVCNTSVTGFCPIRVRAVIINQFQAICTVPVCTPNLQQDRPCYSPATFHVQLNGESINQSVNYTNWITQKCLPYQSVNRACQITPSLVYSKPDPVPSECMGVNCVGFPAHFIYTALPVITRVSPVSLDLNNQSMISVVLTILGAPPFTSSQALCIIGGQMSEINQFEDHLSNSTYPQSVILNCQTPMFDNLLGSSSAQALSVEVSLTGQLIASSKSGMIIQGIDRAAVKQANDLIIFFVCCMIAAFSVLGLGFQHYFCRNCRRVHHDLSKKGKQRGEKGPQRLIDMLEPKVKIGARRVAQEDAQREDAQRELQRRIDETVSHIKAQRQHNKQSHKRINQSESTQSNNQSINQPVNRINATQPKSRFAKAKLLLSMMRADQSEVNESKNVVDNQERNSINQSNNQSIIYDRDGNTSMFGRLRKQSEVSEEPALEATLTGIDPIRN